MTKFLLNAFSLQMLQGDAVILCREVSTLPDDCISAVGHEDTARMLGVPFNRVNVQLASGDVAYVAQLVGGRLPEGTYKLPEGFAFKFFEIKVSSPQKVEEAARWAHSFELGSNVGIDTLMIQ